jgi:hypothetical protein
MDQVASDFAVAYGSKLLYLGMPASTPYPPSPRMISIRCERPRVGGIGLTPYAAEQATAVGLPDDAERLFAHRQHECDDDVTTRRANHFGLSKVKVNPL